MTPSISKILQSQITLLILTAGFASGATLLRKIATSRLHPFQFESVTGTTHAAIGIGCLLYAINRGHTTGLSVEHGRGIVWAVAQALMGCASGIAFMYMIRPGGNIGISSAATSSGSIVMTLLLSTLFFHEEMTLRGLLGTILMIVGLTIATIK